ncbi:MAG: hypothetical protein MI922_13875 [Bacteroidales bacterium]|nr:hypothetical protein [Bacteroidales bacterium]
MIPRIYIAFSLLILIHVGASSQDKNIQQYTPSVLIEKGHWEYKFFNNLYTQTKGFDDSGDKINYDGRGSYFSSINQFLYGVGPKLNVGFDLWVKSVRLDDTESSAFKTLTFENSPNTRTAISGFGPKIKIAPLKSVEKLSLQSTFLIPIASDMEGVSNGKPYLSEDSYIWFTQLFYDQSIGNKFQLFMQFAPWVYYKKYDQPDDASRFSYANPVSLFVSYFPTDRFTIYLQNEYWPSFGSEGIASWFIQEGLGVKYQVIPGFLETEILATQFVLGKNSGAGTTFNFGLRFIR